jgi:hypothetical protein
MLGMRAAIGFCLSLGLAVWAPVALASPIERGGPLLPVTPRPIVADNRWAALVLKALAGDATAATIVGRAYARGSDADRDVPEAMRWFSRAVELGSNEARRELGLLLLRGDGTPKDPEHAASGKGHAEEEPDDQALAGEMAKGFRRVGLWRSNGRARPPRRMMPGRKPIWACTWRRGGLARLIRRRRQPGTGGRPIRISLWRRPGLACCMRTETVSGGIPPGPLRCI